MEFTVYKKSTGEILRTCITSSVGDMSWQLDIGEGIIEGAYSSNEAYVNAGSIVFYTKDQIQAKAARPSMSFVWSNETFAWIDQRTSEQFFEANDKIAKSKRQDLLAASDWTDTASAPARLGEATYAAWQTYRQALRDIPAQSGYPLDVVWPTAPGA